MRSAAILLGLTALGFGCEDEPKPDPPNMPSVESSLAQCRKVGGVFTLNLVEVTVRDLDGVEDLDTPIVYVESEALEMTAASGGTGGEECKADACEVTYTWARTQDSEQIYCGEDGKLLIIDFAVLDLKGFPAEAAIKTVPL